MASTNQQDPGSDAIPITPNDSVDIVGGPCRALLITVGGTLKVTTADSEDRALTVPAGQFNCVVTRVWSTGTTATGITGLV